jgi:hypothetical protein
MVGKGSLQCADFPFEPGDAALVLVKSVERAFEPDHPAGQEPLFPLQFRAQFAESLRNGRRRGDGPDDPTTWDGHGVPSDENDGEFQHSAGDDGLNANPAVGERLFDGRLTLPAGLQLDHFNRIRLEKPIKLNVIAPRASVIVVAEFASLGLADHGILPTGQFHCEAGGFGAEKLNGPVRGRRQSQPATRGLDGNRITNLGFDLHQVGHAGFFREGCETEIDLWRLS